MRACLLVVALVAVTGCGDIPQEASKAQQPAASAGPAIEKPRPPAPQYDAAAFSDLSAALAALGTAAEAGDQEGITKADMWLVHQGASAVLPCADILQNGASDAQRVAVTRVLVQLPGGKQALLAATDVDSKIVRINVIQALSRIQPVDAEIIAACVKAMDDKEPQVQQQAIAALGKMGPAAKGTVPRIQKILNDTNYNQTVRDQARKTLKEIDPRKGLMGLNE
jgi:hypothetical protein